MDNLDFTFFGIVFFKTYLKINILEKYAVWLEQGVRRKLWYAVLALAILIALHTHPTLFWVWSLIIQAALNQRLGNLSSELNILYFASRGICTGKFKRNFTLEKKKLLEEKFGMLNWL